MKSPQPIASTLTRHNQPTGLYPHSRSTDSARTQYATEQTVHHNRSKVGIQHTSRAVATILTASTHRATQQDSHSRHGTYSYESARANSQRSPKNTYDDQPPHTIREHTILDEKPPETDTTQFSHAYRKPTWRSYSSSSSSLTGSRASRSEVRGGT